MMELRSRDHKGIGMAHEKPASISPDDNGVASVKVSN